MQNKLLNRSQFQAGIKSPYFDLPAMAVCRCPQCQHGSRAGRINILILKIMSTHVDAYIMQPYIGNSNMVAQTAFVSGGSLLELASGITVSYPTPFTKSTVIPALESAVQTYATGQDYIIDNLWKLLNPDATRTTSSLSLSLVGTGATGTQISATNDSTIRCNVSTSTTATIGGPSTSLVTLKKCATNDSTEGNWTSVAVFESDQTVTLALILNSVQVVKGQLIADVPAGWYVKLVNSGSGTHSEAFISGEKTIYG